MKFVLGAMLPPWLAVVGQQTYSDPASLFTSLGITGAVVFILWLWRQETAKQRDKALQSLEAVQPVLQEIQAALRRSEDTHQAGTEAAQALTSALRDLPEQQVWFRLIRALEILEQRNDRRV